VQSDLGERTSGFRFLICDRDGRFTAACDGVFSGNGTRVISTPVRSPRANSYAERLAGTLCRQCPDHVLVLTGRHLRNLLAGYCRHYDLHPSAPGLLQDAPQRQTGRRKTEGTGSQERCWRLSGSGREKAGRSRCGVNRRTALTRNSPGRGCMTLIRRHGDYWHTRVTPKWDSSREYRVPFPAHSSFIRRE
jgi:hypothetical protein